MNEPNTPAESKQAWDAVVQALPYLGELDEASRQELSTAVTLRTFAPGDHLATVGEALDVVAVVQAGLLEELDERSVRTRWLTGGDVLGERECIGGAKARTTLRVKRRASVVCLDAVALRRVAQTHADVATAMSGSALRQEGHRRGELRPLAFVQSFVAIDIGNGSAKLAEELVAVCTGRGATSCMVEPPTNGQPDLAARLHEAEARKDTELVVYYADPSEPEWSEAIAGRADCIVAVVPRAPTPELIEKVASLKRDGAFFEVAVCVESSSDSLDAWRMSLPEQEIMALEPGNPAHVEGLIDFYCANFADVNALRQFGTLSELSEFELELIYDDLRGMPVAGGDVIFDASTGVGHDRVFFVVDGRFRVYRLDRDVDEVILEVGPGESLGEASALSGNDLPVRVEARRNGYVGIIDRGRFLHWIDAIPALGKAVARLLGSRLLALDALTAVEPPATLAVVPLEGCNPGRARAFVDDLQRAFDSVGIEQAMVDPERVEQALGRDLARLRSQDPMANIRLDPWLDRLEREHELVLYACDGRDDPWTQRCLRQADLVLLVADAGTDPRMRNLERPLLDGAPGMGDARLVLLQPAGIQEAHGTKRWLDARPGFLHHHVREGNDEDVARLARHVTQSAVGIAFSGASTRGAAHLGVLRALRDKGLPFDVVSGSSSGSAVAAASVMGGSHEDMMQIAVGLLAGGDLKLRRMQLPLTSLMSGKNFGAALKGAFGERRLEDQMIPCTLTGVDLNRHKLVRIRTGPIWLGVRGSCSLPFFWPPVWHGDHLLVDGAIMSYLPIEEILTDCARGLAVASTMDVQAGKDIAWFEGYERYGATLSTWTMLRDKQHKYPNINDVLFHSMCIPSFEQQKRVRVLDEHPSVRYIRPPITHAGFFGTDMEESRKNEQLTYETAMRELEGLDGSTIWSRKA